MHYGEPQDNAPAFSLTIISGGESGQRFVFAQPEVTIGRIADNDLVLYDAAVSRRHLVFYFRNNQFILEDLGSSNGSQLNGAPITQPTVLCEHDILDIGSVRFQFSTDNVSEYDDHDDPTEIELEPVEAPSQPAGPLVRARWEASNGGPLPPEGDTRQFPAHQIRGAQQPIPPSPGVALGPAAHPMPNPGATMDPQAFAHAAVSPLSHAQSTPHRPAPTGMGIRPPSHPPPSTAPRPQPQDPRNQPHAMAPRPAASPSSPHYPAAPPPQAAAPASPRYNAQPSLLQVPDQLLGLGQPRGGVMGRQDKQFQTMERRRVRNASIWSFVALLAIVALFFIPLRQRKNTPGGQILPSHNEAILYNSSIYEKVFGYNKDDNKHPRRVVIQFFYRGGRSRFSYRVSSSLPVRVLLNGFKLSQIEPTNNSWYYDRHDLPRKQLREQSYNYITFIRDNPKVPTIWGVTFIKHEETSFPPADYQKAKQHCDLGQKYYQSRDSSPGLQYKAILQYQQCKDYLTLLKNPPPLYKTAALMISQINRELDLMLHQKLQSARRLSDSTEKQKIYRMLLRYFPDAADPRNHKIGQLQGNK